VAEVQAVTEPRLIVQGQVPVMFALAAK